MTFGCCLRDSFILDRPVAPLEAIGLTVVSRWIEILGTILNVKILDYDAQRRISEFPDI